MTHAHALSVGGLGRQQMVSESHLPDPRVEGAFLPFPDSSARGMLHSRLGNRDQTVHSGVYSPHC